MKSIGVKQLYLGLAILGVIGALWSFFRPSTSPDAIYYNGKFLTLDPKESLAEGVAIKDGLIMKVGSMEEIWKLTGDSTLLIDLQGKTVVPGFIDGHTHPSVAMRMMDTYVDARFPSVPSIEAVLRNLHEKVLKTAKGAWIFIAASSASQTKYLEKRLPTKAELDRASPDNPVWFFNGTHQMVVNSMGLKKLGIEKGITHLKHGGLILTDENGDPTGVLLEAEGDVPDFPSEDDSVSYFSKRIPQVWNKWGYTSLLAIINSEELHSFTKVACFKEKPTIRYTASVWTDPSGKYFPENLSSLTLSKNADPAFFRLGALKVWIDGEVDARSGLLYKPYCGESSIIFGNDTGLLVTPQPEADHFAIRSNEAGLIAMMHCSGDKATDMGLHAYELALKEGQQKALMRIEHFGMFLLSEEQLSSAKQMGIKVSVQPAWLTTLCKANQELLGSARANTGFRFRSMIDAGLEPVAGTDLTGIYLDTINPFLHIWAAVTRHSDMGIFQPEQAVSISEALKMWTIWAAKAQGESDVKGSIEAGKYADMVVLSEDIFAIDKEKLKEVQVLKTIVGGKVVYEAE